MSLTGNHWLTEVYDASTAFSVRFMEKLVEAESDFQRLEIFDTAAMGRVLALNGCFMVTDKDAFIYHEMLVHPAMAATPRPRKALVIGGGDGGAVTEIVKYPSVESVILCEIDQLVVERCREFFPDVSVGLNDPRVTIVYDDGAAFLRNSPDKFDLIVVDSTDPVGPGQALYEVSFYESVRDRLRADGAAVFQTESPLFMEQVFVEAVRNLGRVFGQRSVYPYFATVPCYPGGYWSFTLCSPRVNPLGETTDSGGDPPAVGLRYYDREVGRAAFAKPVFVKRMLEGQG
jgi:spermidine synthase